MKYLFLKLRVTNNPQAVHGVDVGIPTLPGSRHQKEILAMNAAVKRLDVICIGRVAVDLYASRLVRG